MNQFKITCSIAKAYEKRDGGVTRQYIGGLASGTQIDLEGERMAESAISAFQKAIKEGMTLPDGQWSLIPLRSGHRHEWDDVLGYIVGAEVDKEHNLWIEAELDQENPVAMSLYKKLTRDPEAGKPVKLGLSVGGTVLKAGYEWNDETSDFTKTYYNVELREVSVVSQPAYPTSYLTALQKSVNWDALKPRATKAVSSDHDLGGYTPASRFDPTEAMKMAVTRALTWFEQSKGAGAGDLSFAQKIASGERLSPEDVTRMHEYFSAHEMDKHVVGFFADQAGFPAPERVAWDLYGGDPGYRWAIERKGQMPDGEPQDADHTVLERMTDKENSNMEDVIDETTIEKAQIETGMEVVEEVVKTETSESEPVAEEEVSKSDETEGESDPVVDVNATVNSLLERVGALNETVSLLSEQLSAVTKRAHDAEEVQKVEKAKSEATQVDLIKSALVAALEPVLERLDRIENEPMDKSYAVLKSKYDDEPFETRIAREIEAVDGRDAVKRALELAFKGQN